MVFFHDYRQLGLFFGRNMTGLAYLWNGKHWRPVKVLGPARRPGGFRVLRPGQVTPRVVEQGLLREVLRT